MKHRTDMTYVIVDVSALEAIWFRDKDGRSKIIQNSLSTVRKNLAGTKAILKYITAGGEPAPLALIALGRSKAVYTHKEILDYIDNPANGWLAEES